jgi:hypothetical protein
VFCKTGISPCSEITAYSQDIYIHSQDESSVFQGRNFFPQNSVSNLLMVTEKLFVSRSGAGARTTCKPHERPPNFINQENRERIIDTAEIARCG